MSKIRLGLPSKGRLKDESINFFSKKNLNIQNSNSRNYFFNFEENENFDGIFLHAREIIERLGDGSLDIGFSGFDLFKESEFNTQKKINLVKKYNFGKANLVVAIPDPWIDVQTFLNLPLLGIPMLIVFFIIYFKFIAAPTAGTFFFDPKSEIN